MPSRSSSENPYRLARDIRGIGFKSADQIAMRLGIEKTAMIRARAGISYALAEAMDEGHCGLPTDELRERAAALLEIAVEVVDAAIVLELADGAVVGDTALGRPCLFLAGLYRAEQGIAERLLRLSSGSPPWPAVDPDRAIPWVEQRTGLILAASQREAVRLALCSKVLVITGGPGVGKTTLVNAILEILRARTQGIALAAPTGRAAKRLREATGLEAKTLHRLLESDPARGGFKRGEEHPLDCDLLVVDEVSMVDVPLMHSLLKAVPRRAALILVGDVDQLPSVGPGQVLADLIGSGAVPVVRLTEIFRQAAQSRIVTNAHRINQGLLPEPGQAPGSDFHLVRCQDPEDGVAKLLEVVTRRIPARFGLDPIRDVQVLCPMNRGGLGARSLNLELQRLLNPPGEVRVERFGSTFRPGDKVMQIANDYDKEVFNGDLGRVKAIDLEAGELRGRVRRPRGGLRLRRAGRAGAGLCHHGAQGAGLGVPGGGDPADHAALPDAAAEPALHRRDPRPAAGGAGGAAQGGGDRGQGPAASGDAGRSWASGSRRLEAKRGGTMMPT